MSYIGAMLHREDTKRARSAVIVVLATVLASACSSAPARREAPPWASSQRRVTAASRAYLGSGGDAGGVTTAAGLVERSLLRRGLRFGTDGSVGALHGYIQSRHRFVAPREARRGDVVFFRRSGSQTSCRDHVGLVEDVEPSGRVTFREVRDGVVRQSHFHPTRPTDRRDESGRVLNSFLRGKRADDPDDALYYAGQMACAIGRIVPRQ